MKNPIIDKALAAHLIRLRDWLFAQSNCQNHRMTRVLKTPKSVLTVNVTAAGSITATYQNHKGSCYRASVNTKGVIECWGVTRDNGINGKPTNASAVEVSTVIRKKVRTFYPDAF